MENKQHSPKFVHFRMGCSVYYPTGSNIEYNFAYIREAAYAINKTFPTGNIILVVKGCSGTILAGGVSYNLIKFGRGVTVSILRESNVDSHGTSFEGIPDRISKNTHIIILDDFVSSGKTINFICEELKKRTHRRIFDGLCIGNSWQNGIIYDIPKYVEFINRFRYIICNDPKYDKD